MRAELLVLAALVGCGGDASPREPIEELIALIKADDPSGLASLCVPEVRDGDARRVCMARREDAQAWAQVRAWLGDARVVRVAEFHGDEVVVEVEANAFLLHMVRNIAGSLLAVGTGERPPQWLAGVLESRDRTLAGATAPAQGLYLVDVGYDAQLGLPRAPAGPWFAC